MWNVNEIQFARLIVELMEVEGDSINFPKVAASMDLSMDEFNKLADRAEAVWGDSSGNVLRLQVTEKYLNEAVAFFIKLYELEEDADWEKIFSVARRSKKVIDDQHQSLLRKTTHIDNLNQRIMELEEILGAREEQLTAKAAYIKEHQDQLRADRHNIAAKLGLTVASTWEEIYDEITNLRHKHGTLARELNKELERYVKLDDVRYELEVKLKHLNDKHKILMASYHELERERDAAQVKEEEELYLGELPYTVRVPGKTPFAEYLYASSLAFSSRSQAVRMGLTDAIILDSEGVDVTEVIRVVYQRS